MKEIKQLDLKQIDKEFWRKMEAKQRQLLKKPEEMADDLEYIFANPTEVMIEATVDSLAESFPGLVANTLQKTRK